MRCLKCKFSKYGLCSHHKLKYKKIAQKGCRNDCPLDYKNMAMDFKKSWIVRNDK